MFLFHFLVALAGPIAIDLAAAALPLNGNLQVHHSPGASSTDTLRAFRRSFSAAAVKRDTPTVFKNSTALDTSWNGTVLFSTSGYVHST